MWGFLSFVGNQGVKDPGSEHGPLFHYRGPHGYTIIHVGPIGSDSQNIIKCSIS